MKKQKILELFIIRALERKVTSEDDLRQLKREMAREFSISIFSNSDVLAVYRTMIAEGKIVPDYPFLHIIAKRKIRSLSGVAIITVLTKAYYCPGRCVYCPTEARMPKSYIASEPGAARALRHHFDPYQQVTARLETLTRNGHSVDKCELIILGGTWTAYKRQYQTIFIKRCFDAFNGVTSRSLDDAKQYNETCARRVIGLTLETRPDHVTRVEARRMRWLGCTRVQLGVQTTDNTVLQLTRRDQTNEQVIKATRILKEAGFKISHHYMQNLPGATIASDVRTIDDAFTRSDFQPDHIKLYPTVVVKSALLYHWWKKGAYQSYTQEQLIDLLIEIKKRVPPWVRIERLVRDIPSQEIHAGNTVTNLRQLMQQRGVLCQCIRCREPRDAHVTWNDIFLVRRDYDASNAKEIFLSFESKDQKIIYAFLRLRLQNISRHWMPVLQHAAIIREIHTYGKLAPIASGKGAVQHGGLGRRLLIEAEHIAQDAGYKKIAVIAGVGVREYFRKRGYHLDREYMIKKFDKKRTKMVLRKIRYKRSPLINRA